MGKQTRGRRSAPPDRLWAGLPPRAGRLIPAAALAALVVVAYLPAAHGQFIWDDFEYIAESEVVQAPRGLGRIWTDPTATPQYYPLTFSSFWVEYRFWGLDPLGYHLVNIALHAVCAVLAYRVLLLLGVPGAWWAAAAFGLHPVNVESVAWVTERKNVMSGAFALLALLAWMRFRPIRVDQAGPPGLRQEAVHAGRRWWFYAAALLLFCLGLLSKTSVSPLPVVILAMTWWKAGRIRWKDALLLAPMFLIATGAGLLTIHVEDRHFQSVPGFGGLSAGQRLLLAGRALWFYAGKIAWPADLMPVYPRWDLNVGAWWQYLYPLTAAGVLAALWRGRRRIGRGPLAAAMVFAGILLPALGFFSIAYHVHYSYVADHFVYLATVPILALAAGTAAAWSRRWHRAGRFAAAICGAILLAVLGTLSARRAAIYHDDLSLFRETVRGNPGSPRAHLDLAGALAERGYSDEALVQYDLTLGLDPGYAIAYCNRGGLHMNRGDLPKAISDFDQAIRLSPRWAAFYHNRAMARQEQWRLGLNPEGLAQAILDYGRAIDLEPTNAAFHGNRGRAHYVNKDYRSAIRDLGTVVRLSPDDPENYFNRAVAYHADRQYDHAWADVERCRARGGRPQPDFLRQLVVDSGRPDR